MAGTGLPPLGLGCAQLGDLYEELTEDEAGAIVDAAWDCGVRMFDTAPHYGLGLSERRLGRALRGRERSEYRVSTKVGRRLVQSSSAVAGGGLERVTDYSRDGVLATLDGSLQRLDLDRVDCVLVHDPQLDPAAAIDTGYRTLHELRDQGVVTSIGVGTADVALLLRFVRETDIDMILLAGRMTLLNQEASPELLPECESRGIRVINAGVYSTGILASDEIKPGAHFEYRAAPAEVIERAERILTICSRHGVRLPAAALHYGFRSAAVESVLVGAETPAQIVESARMMTETVPQRLWHDLEAAGLIPTLPDRGGERA